MKKKSQPGLIVSLLLAFSVMVISLSAARADGDAPVIAGCPLSQGYWANHPAEWRVFNIMLGVQYYSQSELLLLLPGGGGDASTQLAVQLAATKLNLAAGSDPAPITAAMLQADAVLAQFTGKLPYNVVPSTPTGQALVSLAGMLDSYNNGQMIAICASTPTATLTVTPGPSPTPVASATPGPSPTPSSTSQPVTIIIEGPVQVINVNVVTIYDIDVTVNASDPILTKIRVGDFVRVEGNTLSGTTGLVVVAVNVFVVNVDVVITNNNTVVWEDDGDDCGNAPPPWAPAHGWRRRCQGQNQSIMPGNSQGNNGNGHGNGNGNGNGNRNHDDDEGDDD